MTYIRSSGESGAVLSDCRKYRYQLFRKLQGAAGPVVFLMLNPSTADETEDDPTIRRCIGFANRLDAESLIVVNLYALRATDPDDLFMPKPLKGEPLKFDDRQVGPQNDEHIIKAIRQPSATVIAAWGSHPMAKKRGAQVLSMLEGECDVHCLRTNRDGQPAHPLYLKKDSPILLLQPEVPF